MNEAPAQLFSANDAPRTELARLCRQLCIAREALPLEARAPLDHELTDALAAVRLTYGAETVNHHDLADLFRLEQNRIADATLLAELIAPRLARLVQSPVHAAPSASSTPPHESPHTTPPPRTPNPFSTSSSSTAAPAGPPDIADLLDGMLAQDREEHTRHSGARR